MTEIIVAARKDKVGRSNAIQYRVCHNMRGLCMAVLVLVGLVQCSSADPEASIEIVGIKLLDKKQISVETEIDNISNKNISVVPRLWVEQTSLKDEPFSPGPVFYSFKVMPGAYSPSLIIHTDQEIGMTSFGKLSSQEIDPLSQLPYPPTPLVLKPGEKIKIPALVAFSKDITVAVSKDVWVRVGLYQSGEGDKKTFPIEYTHGNLYKLEKPKDGESIMALQPIKAPF